MGERLQKFMAAAGVASRRASEKLIEEGRVTVNGIVATLGMSVEEGDEVLLDGRPSAGIISCASSTRPQTEQCAPSVQPFSVAVGALPGSFTALCPLGAIFIRPVVITPQIWQRLLSVRPPSVQVAGLALPSPISLWPVAGISSPPVE